VSTAEARSSKLYLPVAKVFGIVIVDKDVSHLLSDMSWSTVDIKNL